MVAHGNNYASPSSKIEPEKKSEKDVYSFFEPSPHSVYKNYDMNNWIFMYPAPNKSFFYPPQYYILHKLHQKGGALWLNANGDICYRLSIYEDIHVTTCEKASRVLSNFLGEDIVIGKTNHIRKSNNTYQDPIKKIEISEQSTTIYLSIHDLLLVRIEMFDLYSNTEFQRLNNVIYRNTLKPSTYMISNSSEPQKPSIILQYLYHLANYNQERFYFLLDWLASCYCQNFLPGVNTNLVLIGNKKTGVNLLFDLIIRFLFGISNCISVTYDFLQINNLHYALSNKLFYNLDNIGTQVNHDQKSKRILNTLINEQKVYSSSFNKTTSEETYIQGRFLITERDTTIPYLNKENKNFILFKVPDDIETIFLPENMKYSDTEFDTIEKYLYRSCYQDLGNFSNILKSHITDIDSMDNFINMQDDRDLLQQSIDDKLKAFHTAIISMDKAYFEKIKNIDADLYQEIIQDFEAKRIKQPNLLPCFKYIYGKDENLTSRTLMTALRKFNPTFYSTKTMGIGTGGIKYFKYQTCQIDTDFINLHESY